MSDCEAQTRDWEQTELAREVVGRSIVSVELDGQTFPDGSQSTDRITLGLDDGRRLAFDGVWCNDSTADVAWDIEEAEAHG